MKKLTNTMPGLKINTWGVMVWDTMPTPLKDNRPFNKPEGGWGWPDEWPIFGGGGNP